MLIFLGILLVVFLEMMIIEASSEISAMRDAITYTFETVGASYSELLKIAKKNNYIYERNFNCIQTKVENKDVLFYAKDVISYWRLKLNTQIKNNALNTKRKNNYLKTALK